MKHTKVNQRNINETQAEGGLKEKKNTAIKRNIPYDEYRKTYNFRGIDDLNKLNKLRADNWDGNSTVVVNLINKYVGINIRYGNGGIVDASDVKLQTGLYVVYGYSGSGKSSRFIFGSSDVEGEHNSFLKELVLNEVKTTLNILAEPEYENGVPFSQQVAYMYDYIVTHPGHVHIIDSLTGFLQYEDLTTLLSDHGADEVQKDSHVPTSIQYIKANERLTFRPSTAALSGGVPGAFGHQLRNLHSTLKAKKSVGFALMNPLFVANSQIEERMIADMNGMVNGVLPMDGFIRSEGVRFGSSSKKQFRARIERTETTTRNILYGGGEYKDEDMKAMYLTRDRIRIR